MKKFLMLATLTCCLLGLVSCNSEENTIVGQWNEYRADGDDYLLSSWKFNEDGTGVFTVNGMSNTQKVSFLWEKDESNILVKTNNDNITLELNNGLLIEKNSFGTTVFKKK